MQVRLRFFAAPREAVGRAEVDFPLDQPEVTVSALLDALVARYPALARWRAHVLVSVNREFASSNDLVRDGDEVAFMPPVSGGSDAGRAQIHEGALSVDDALGALVREGAGAAVAFMGIVRGTRGDASRAEVAHLEFDAYREMADQELARVRQAACSKFGLVDATILHRVGRLRVGEDIVLVVVTAAHRAQAFEAASWIMDELKTVVPIWKKEVSPSGEGKWVNDERE